MLWFVRCYVTQFLLPSSDRPASALSRIRCEAAQTSNEEEHLAYLLQEVDQLSKGSGDDQTYACGLLRGETNRVMIRGGACYYLWQFGGKIPSHCGTEWYLHIT